MMNVTEKYFWRGVDCETMSKEQLLNVVMMQAKMIKKWEESAYDRMKFRQSIADIKPSQTGAY